MRAGILFPCLPLCLPPSYSLLVHHSHPPQSDFFRRFPRRAGCNPATPIVTDEGGRETQREEECGGKSEEVERAASCYICNIFVFTIFQLIYILEPLLFASTLRSPFFPHFSVPSRSPVAILVLESLVTGGCCTSHPPLPDCRPRALNNFSCVFPPRSISQSHSTEAHKGFHFLK